MLAGFLFLAVLLNCGSARAVRAAAAQGPGGERSVAPQRSRRPQSRVGLILTYVTWLDKETIILAMSGPAPERRIVLGIGTLPTDETLPTNLYQIKGFGELVPLSALPVFRLALGGKPQSKYRVMTRGGPIGAPVSFNQIDQTFRDYIRITAAKSGDLDVWDVLSDGGEIRVVILGDLVLVKPAEASNPQSKAESAMVELLTKMALNEKKGSRMVLLRSGCHDAASIIQNVQKNPFNGESRWALRKSVTGKITGTNAEPNEYLVTNSGWESREIHLDVVSGPASESNFKVMALVGQNAAIPVERDLMLPPCETAHISVEPQHWYQELPEPVNFRYDENEASLSVVVPEVGFRWVLSVGIALVTAIGLLILLGLTMIERWRARNFKPRLEKIKSQDEFVPQRLESVDQTSPKLLELQHQLEVERAENEHWRKSLQELGDSPEAIVKTWQDLKKAKLPPTPQAMDERVFRARLVSRGIKKAGEQLIEIANSDGRFLSLVKGTGLELTTLASHLLDAASSSEATLTRQLNEQEGMDQVLRAFLRQLLMQEYSTLLSMLRLWQVLEVYCCDSEDPLATALHLQSKEYRRTCVQFLSDCDCLGVHFQKIGFLKDPIKAGLRFTECPSAPQVQNNFVLSAIIRSRLDSDGGSKYWGAIADVGLWGVECDLDPGLNCETQLWRWRSVGLG